MLTMKNEIKYSLLLILLASLVSCEDIIHSDKNYIKNTFEFNAILEDQTKSVIMPLHPGNKWLYNVAEYYKGGLKTIHKDSILVLREVEIDKGKWFEVYHPFINKTQNILLTNTKTGLWMRCANCNNIILLEAQYPVGSNPYFAGSVFGPALVGYRYNDSLSIHKDTLHKYIEWIVSHYPMPDEKYDYNSWYFVKSKSYKTGYKTDSYVVDFGLMKGRQSYDMFYSLAGAELFRDGKPDKSIPYTEQVIDLGNVITGNVATKNKDLFVNNFSSELIVTEIDFYPNTTEFVISGTYPQTIGPGEGFNADIQYRPKSLGRKEILFVVFTSKDEYYFKLIGNGI